MKIFELSIALVVTVTSAAVPAFDFKGYQLGASRAELVQRPLQADHYGAKSISCSDRAKYPNFVEFSEKEKEAGVIQCLPTQYIGGSITVGGIDLSPEFGASVRFYLFEDRLFRIEVYPDIEALADIETSLQTKFGTPTSILKGKMQVKSGAIFPQVTKVWRRGTQTIVMTAPDLTTQKMTIVYTEMATQKRVDGIIAASERPGGIM